MLRACSLSLASRLLAGDWRQVVQGPYSGANRAGYGAAFELTNHADDLGLTCAVRPVDEKPLHDLIVRECAEAKARQELVKVQATDELGHTLRS